MQIIQEVFTMNTTTQIGFGCFLPGKSETEAIQIINTAMETGYRYFDTASFYGTEKALGTAIQNSGLDRQELRIASKLWINERGYQNAKDAFYRSLDALNLDYLDTYLIHWPKASFDDTTWEKINDDTFRAMEELQEEGLIRKLGVSNFLSHHLTSLTKLGHTPDYNQLELHPGFMQECSVAASKAIGAKVQAWSPLGRGALLQNDYLKYLSNKYGKSVPQICLIYLLQQDIMPIVKASSKERMLQNLDVFDVTLSDEDISMLSCMPQTGWSGEHPDFVIPGQEPFAF